jgi:hypothetical protein
VGFLRHRRVGTWWGTWWGTWSGERSGGSEPDLAEESLLPQAQGAPSVKLKDSEKGDNQIGAGGAASRQVGETGLAVACDELTDLGDALGEGDPRRVDRLGGGDAGGQEAL